MSTGKFLTGVIIGGAIGAIAGILLAPKSGEETRELLAEGSKDVMEKTNKTVKTIQDKAEVVVSDMQKKGDEIMTRIQELINAQKEEAEQVCEN